MGADDDEAFFVELVVVKLDNIDGSIRSDTELFEIANRPRPEQHSHMQAASEGAGETKCPVEWLRNSLDLIGGEKHVELERKVSIAPHTLGEDARLRQDWPGHRRNVLDNLDFREGQAEDI
ncbi:MAG: hypothetical protein U0893_27340 [Chloroflexota bacterium]